MPTETMRRITANFPDIDRLEGYSDDMECDPPEDYFDAFSQNLENMEVVSTFVTDHLLTTRGAAVIEPADRDDPNDFYSRPARILPSPGDGWDPHDDPTEAVIDAARAAARTGDASVLRTALARMEAVNGTGVNCRSPNSLQTPLHFAAVGGETEVAELLVAAGADPDAVCGEGETVLHKAAEAGRRGVVRVLLRAGAAIDPPRENDGATPLHMAALAGHADLCRLLLRAGADVEARTPRGHSPLHFAVMGGHWRSGVIEELVAHGADVDGQDYVGQSALVRAIYVNEPGALELLLDLGADVEAADAGGDTPLHHAMHVGVEEGVRALLRRGANVFAVNREGERAHECLAATDNWKVDPMSGETVFTQRAQRRLDAILRPHKLWWWPGFWFGPYMRTDLGFKLDAAERRAGTWLAGAVRGAASYLRDRWAPFYRPLLGNTATAYERFCQRRLLEVEEYHDKQTWGGDNEGDVWLYEMGTPAYERLKSYSELQRAVALRQPEVVEQLLAAGVVPWGTDAAVAVEADLNQVLVPGAGGGLVHSGDGMLRPQPGLVDVEVRDEAGATPLVVAAALGDARSVAALARAGASLDAADAAGSTALKRAAAEGRLGMVEQLLALGAVPDHAPAVDGGRTALMLACGAGHREAVRALIRAGADVDRQDALGRTALNHAVDGGRQELARWLRGRGATMRTPQGDVRGFPGEQEPEEASSYSPVDDPDHDQRNPRYTGAFG
jgi:ankyrin repeat protein